MTEPRGRRFGTQDLWLLSILTASAIALVAAAAIGTREADRSAQPAAPAERGRSAADPDVVLPADEGAGDTGDGGPASDAPGSPSRGSARRQPGGSGRTSAPGGGGGGGELPSQPGATREGVHTDHVEFGIHGPFTIEGAPINVAEDLIIGLKGYVTHVNRQGGVHGRKVRLFLEDDRYSTEGAARAADALTKEIKPFLMAGVLGVDQVGIGAKAARDAGIPYLGGGGPEPEWKPLELYQAGQSYDTSLERLAEYICRFGEQYVGAPVRIGTSTLNSTGSKPVERRFVEDYLTRCGIKTDAKARILVDKPQNETSYLDRVNQIRSAYGGQGANLMIPIQDPITTSRQVQEMEAQRYEPKWTFSSFVHDADLILALMAKNWVGYRGLSSGCYYQYERRGDPNLCSALGRAHADWVSLGRVTYDENAGGCDGGACEYDYNEQGWVRDGQAGSAGYQYIHLWLGALRSAGPDPTRERFLSALDAYDHYSNVLTGPITFKGSANTVHGAEHAVVLEGGADDRYRQVADLTPGLVDHF